jgi:hypothetical protein
MTSDAYPHDENQQAFEHDGNILIAVVDETYGVSEDEAWERDRERFRLSLEREFGVRFEDGNVGPGADLPAYLTLLQTTTEVPLWVVVASIFFLGKPLKENMEAWPEVARKLQPFLKRPAFFNRQGAAVLAVGAVCAALGGDVPKSLQLQSYRTPHVAEPYDLRSMQRCDGIAEAPPTLSLGFIRHVFELEADGAQFRVGVDGTEVKFVRLYD